MSSSVFQRSPGGVSPKDYSNDYLTKTLLCKPIIFYNHRDMGVGCENIPDTSSSHEHFEVLIIIRIQSSEKSSPVPENENFLRICSAKDCWVHFKCDLLSCVIISTVFKRKRDSCCKRSSIAASKSAFHTKETHTKCVRSWSGYTATIFKHKPSSLVSIPDTISSSSKQSNNVKTNQVNESSPGEQVICPHKTLYCLVITHNYNTVIVSINAPDSARSGSITGSNVTASNSSVTLSTSCKNVRTRFSNTPGYILSSINSLDSTHHSKASNTIFECARILTVSSELMRFTNIVHLQAGTAVVIMKNLGCGCSRNGHEELISHFSCKNNSRKLTSSFLFKKDNSEILKNVMCQINNKEVISSNLRCRCTNEVQNSYLHFLCKYMKEELYSNSFHNVIFRYFGCNNYSFVKGIFGEITDTDIREHSEKLRPDLTCFIRKTNQFQALYDWYTNLQKEDNASVNYGAWEIESHVKKERVENQIISPWDSRHVDGTSNSKIHITQLLECVDTCKIGREMSMKQNAFVKSGIHFTNKDRNRLSCIKTTIRNETVVINRQAGINVEDRGAEICITRKCNSSIDFTSNKYKKAMADSKTSYRSGDKSSEAATQQLSAPSIIFDVPDSKTEGNRDDDEDEDDDESSEEDEEEETADKRTRIKTTIEWLDNFLIVWHAGFLIMSMFLLGVGIVLKVYFYTIIERSVKSSSNYVLYSHFVKIEQIPPNLEFGHLTDVLGEALIVLSSLYMACVLCYMTFLIHRITFTLPLVVIVSGAVVLTEVNIINIYMSPVSAANEEAKKELKEMAEKEYAVDSENEFSVTYDLISIWGHCCGIVDQYDFQNVILKYFLPTKKEQKTLQVPPTCCQPHLFAKGVEEVVECASTAEGIFTLGCYQEIYIWLRLYCNLFSVVVVLQLLDLCIHIVLYKKHLSLLTLQDRT